MRHVSWGHFQPSEQWQRKAKQILEKLKLETDVEKRNKLIDANSGLWSELKDELLKLSHDKCWFSEAKDCFSYFEVEHFRPKKSAKELDGATRDGYWWVSFDWQNFRICGDVGNKKKGTFFPLRPGTAPIGPDGDLRYEIPLLLDPTDPQDPQLITFNLEGDAIVSGAAQDDWARERAEYSIKRYNLNFDKLAKKRKSTWQECWLRLRQYFSELERLQVDQMNHVARHSAKEALLHVLDMIRHDRELSSVVRACIHSTGDDRALKLLAHN